MGLLGFAGAVNDIDDFGHRWAALASDDGRSNDGRSNDGRSTTVTPTTIPVVAGNGVLDATANRAVSNIGSNGTAAVAGTSQTRSTGSTSGSGLAYTGSTVRPLILAAVSLIAAGALFVLSARRRRRD
ncbi:MAG: hypothetical protein V9E99_07095 [Microthrixaceae bacterium]